MLMRRGHRLHSIPGAGSDLDMRRFTISLPETESRTRLESSLIDAVTTCDVEAVKQIKNECLGLKLEQNLMQDLIIEAVGLANKELLVELVDLLASNNVYSYEVGEFAVIVSTSSRDSQLAIAILDLWVERKSYKTYSPLDVVAISLEASTVPSNKRSFTYKPPRNCSSLAETAIYVATVDKYSDVLKNILGWVAINKEEVIDIKMENADPILHASLEDDKEQVRILYGAGFRLCADTTRRLNKDYLKKIKLFKARASPVYCTVAFEQSEDVEEDDPMKKCLDYALQAKQYANKIQDFNKDFNDIAEKCENFAIKMLEKCTTKHEIQTLLQTKSYKGHHDANFNIAILDGHKELVAHEKFQQLLHKKWGQRDRVHYGDEIRYNIFWSEMSKLQKFAHFLKQVPLFFILPLIFLISTICPIVEKNSFFQYFIIQTNIPVNRFIYFEISKTLFCLIIFLTLIDDEEAALIDLLAVLWIVSFLLEDFRTIQRLYKQGGVENRSKTLRRWLTFKNIYVLMNNLIFLTALILRYLAFAQNECRTGCPYEGNKMAFVGACLWAVGALMTFLRNVQTGLMWRQVGPIIISMTYMIIDVFVFLFIFVIVYISFTLVTVYVYEVYDNDRTQFFNSHKSAFKLFWWSLIRTGNPHFPNIREYEQTLHYYNSTCIGDLLQDDTVEAKLISNCAMGKDGMVGEFDDDIEEGIPYITGNVLWAVYQFITFIVLLSVLRARMVNTYHRIFREADVQWKFFRASLWWKYLDHNTVLPPPFTLIFLLYSASRSCWKKVQFTKDQFSAESDSLYDRKDFYKRYKRLLITLVKNEDNSWGFNRKSRKSLGRSMLDCGGD